MNKFLAAAAVTAMFALPVVSFAHDNDDGPRHARYYRGDRDHDGDRDCDHDNRRVVLPYPAYANRAYPQRRYTPAQVYRTAAVYRTAPVVYRPLPVYRSAPVVYPPARVYNPTPVVYGQPYPYPQQAPVYVQKKKHHDDNDDALWAVGGFVLGAIVGHEVGTH